MPFLHFNFGLAYLGMGEYDKSEAEFRKDIAIDPELPDNYYQLGDFVLTRCEAAGR